MPNQELTVQVHGEDCTYRLDRNGKVREVIAGPFVEHGETVSIVLSPPLDPPEVPGAITTELVFHRKEHTGMRDDRQPVDKALTAQDLTAAAVTLGETRQATTEADAPVAKPGA